MSGQRMPICGGCARFRGYAMRACEAFPEGIPERIWTNETDHRFSTAGDHGLVFQPVTLDDDLYASEVFDYTIDQREAGESSAT